MTTSTRFWGAIVKNDRNSPAEIDLYEDSVLHITKAINLSKEDVILFMSVNLFSVTKCSEAAIARFVDSKNPEVAIDIKIDRFDIKIDGNATRAVSFWVESPGNPPRFTPATGHVSVSGTITTSED
jgi:hypothetical protein